MEQHETGIVVILLERKRGKTQPQKKPLLTACLHPATKGKPEISEQVLIKAVSSQSNRQCWGDRLPGLRAAWLDPCACSVKPLVPAEQKHCMTAAGLLHSHRVGEKLWIVSWSGLQETCTLLQIWNNRFTVCKKPHNPLCTVPAVSSTSACSPYRGKEGGLRQTPEGLVLRGSSS